MNREEIILKEQRDSLLRQALELSSNPQATKADLKKADILLAQAAQLRSRDVMAVRAAAALEDATGQRVRIDTAEQREATAERTMLRKILVGPSNEYRSYSPLVSASSPYVPQQFVDTLASMQMSAGPLFAGSPAVSNVYAEEGNVAKLPVLDDTESTGFLQTEAALESDGVTSPSNVTFNLKRFSSGIILYSMELGQDVQDFDSFQNILAMNLGKRLGRIQNSTFLASLLTTLSSNSSASVTSETASLVTVDDIQVLLGSVNAEYRQSSKAAFLMNSGTQLALSKLKSTGGITLLPKVLSAQPQLFGFPVFISDFCDDVATGNKPVIFGDFSTVYFRSINGFSVQTFNERYVDQGSFALRSTKRSDMQYVVPSTSDSALKFITVS